LFTPGLLEEDSGPLIIKDPPSLASTKRPRPKTFWRFRADKIIFKSFINGASADIPVNSAGSPSSPPSALNPATNSFPNKALNNFWSPPPITVTFMSLGLRLRIVIANDPRPKNSHTCGSRRKSLPLNSTGALNKYNNFSPSFWQSLNDRWDAWINVTINLRKLSREKVCSPISRKDLFSSRIYFFKLKNTSSLPTAAPSKYLMTCSRVSLS